MHPVFNHCGLLALATLSHSLLKLMNPQIKAPRYIKSLFLSIWTDLDTFCTLGWPHVREIAWIKRFPLTRRRQDDLPEIDPFNDDVIFLHHGSRHVLLLDALFVEMCLRSLERFHAKLNSRLWDITCSIIPVRRRRETQQVHNRIRPKLKWVSPKSWFD